MACLARALWVAEDTKRGPSPPNKIGALFLVCARQANKMAQPAGPCAAGPGARPAGWRASTRRPALRAAPSAGSDVLSQALAWHTRGGSCWWRPRSATVQHVFSDRSGQIDRAAGPAVPSGSLWLAGLAVSSQDTLSNWPDPSPGQSKPLTLACPSSPAPCSRRSRLQPH